MPGLFGVLNLESLNSEQFQESKQLFSAMANSLCHHDDDIVDESVLFDGRILIGRIGLAHQNLISWPEVYSGEHIHTTVFPAGALLETNTPKVKNGFPNRSNLRHWQGIYAALVHEPRSGKSLIIADRKASVPIYYTKVQNQLIFAPEIKALLANPKVSREIDLEALATFLAQGYLLGDQTLFRKIRRLRGGEYLNIENRIISRQFYWQFSPGSQVGNSSEIELMRELGHLIKSSTQRHLGDLTRSIIFLSGGMDSRGILGNALTINEGQGDMLNTVSWGTEQGPEFSDAAIAASIAQRYHTNHRFMRREIKDYADNFRLTAFLIDGLSEVAAYHSQEYQIMAKLREEGFQRAMRGDEVFGWSFHANSIPEGFALANLRRLRNVNGLRQIIQPEYYEILCEASDNAVSYAMSEVEGLTPNQAKDFFYFSHRLQCYLQTSSYYKQIELDHRNILLDDPILDFIAKIPDHLRVDKLLYRKTIAREFPELAKIPLAQESNLESWVKVLGTETPVRSFAESELLDHSSQIWEFINPIGISKTISALQDCAREELAPSHKIHPKALLKNTLGFIAPKILLKIRARNFSNPHSTVKLDEIVMRALTLKNWIDTFHQQ
jgi:asparagine synthetase B (glutamine-hydrolysing)